MIAVTIEGARQAISYVDGSMTNELLIRLPSGQQVSAAVDEATMKAVAMAFAEQGGPALQRAVAAVSAAPAKTHWPQPAKPEETVRSLVGLEIEQGDNQEFGGNYDGPPETSNADEWLVPTAHSTPLRVSADARGNPVVQGNNVLDRTEMAGGLGADLEEDGVGSV
jgi:hypothetical protein